MKVKLSKSPLKAKKYRVTFEDNTHVDFGAAGMSDFTRHKDPKRKDAYIARHSTNENWSDPSTAGFWSRWLLWEKPTIADSKKFITSYFGIEFK